MLLFSGVSFAGDREEIADLKKRVAELEEQNRRILQLLEQLRPATAVSVTPSVPPSVSDTSQPVAALPVKPVPTHANQGVSIGEGNYLKFYGWLPRRWRLSPSRFSEDPA